MYCILILLGGVTKVTLTLPLAYISERDFKESCKSDSPFLPKNFTFPHGVVKKLFIKIHRGKKNSHGIAGVKEVTINVLLAFIFERDFQDSCKTNGPFDKKNFKFLTALEKELLIKIIITARGAAVALNFRTSLLRP